MHDVTRASPLAVVAVLALACTPTGDPDPGPGTALEPGEYLSPLVRLQRLQGDDSHLHVDEVRLREDDLLLQCSYTFGVVDASDAAGMRYLSQGLRHEVPGDGRRPGCIHLAWDGDRVYTTHRGNIRNPTFLSGWDIGDPRSPVQLPVLQEPGVSYEGIDVAGGSVFVGLHEDGLGVYRWNGTRLERVGTAEGLQNAWGVYATADRVYVADGPGGLVTVDASDPSNPSVLGRVATGGHARGVVVADGIAYVAAGAAGLVAVDVSDPAQPAVVSRVAMPGAAVRVDHSDGHVFVAAWNDARVYDVSTPAEPRFVGAVRFTREDGLDDGDRPPPTSRVLGIAARGNDVFVGNWHVLHSYRMDADRAAPNLRLPESAFTTDFGPVSPGETRTLPLEVANQGTAPLTVMGAWVAGGDFTVSPPRFRVGPGQATTVSVTFAPSVEEPAEGYLRLLSDDPQSPLRRAYLVGNQPGLGVGMPLPETEATLMDGTAWSSSELEGDVAMLAYFATF